MLRTTIVVIAAILTSVASSTFSQTSRSSPGEEPSAAPMDMKANETGSAQITLTVEESATLRIKGAVPAGLSYFAGDWSGRKYASPGLMAGPAIIFPEVAQTTDSKQQTVIKYYSGVPCNVMEFRQDNIEIHEPVVIDVGVDSVLRGGELPTIPDGAWSVNPGAGIAYSRSQRSRGTSTIRIGPVPGKQGLTIGGDASEVEVYKCNKPVEVASYTPNLWVSATSMVPFECDDEELPKRAIPTAIGVLWRFPRKGIKVQLGGTLLTATEDGGTVLFTKDGPRLKGVRLNAAR